LPPNVFEASAVTTSVGHWLTTRLRRVTSSGQLLPEIDGLRFVAIAAVFLYHLRGYLETKATTAWAVPVDNDWLARLTLYGNFGVELFFAISGFLLALPFAAHHLNGAPSLTLRQYFGRRLTRLEPPYLVSLLIMFLLYLVVGHPLQELLPNLLANCCYVRNLVHLKGGSLNCVTWSLEIEVQCYLLTPLFAFLFQIRNAWQRRAVLVTVAYSAIVLQWLVLEPGTSVKTILNFLQCFFVGFLLADVYLTDWRGQPTRGVRWDGVLLGSFAALLSLCLTGNSLLRWLFPVLLFMFLAAALRGVYVRRLLIAPFCTTVGGMCYTIYLYHYQVISLVGRLTPGWTLSRYFFVALLSQAIVVGVAVLMFCTVLFILIERPCMRKGWPQDALGWVQRLLGVPRGGQGLVAMCPENAGQLLATTETVAQLPSR
jgi:peptidoglycan/LPS O-acetylase OafA/YrhL